MKAIWALCSLMGVGYYEVYGGCEGQRGFEVFEGLVLCGLWNLLVL